MLGYRKRIHLMNPIVPSLSGDKMSSSEADGKIDLLDGPEIVKKKLKKAFCEPGKVENNWCLSFSKYAIFPILHNQNKEFEIFQSESKTVLKYMNYIDLEKDYIDTKIHPSDMKESVCSYVNMLLKPIITEFQSTELKELCERAYSDNSKKASNVPKVAASNPVFDEIDLLAFDLRVAKLVDTRTHPRADNLLIHNVVVDKETNKLKTICSNVKPYYKNCVDWPKNQLCIILSNTKPVDIKGIQSSGSILFHCTNKPEKRCTILQPPDDSIPGSLIWFDGLPRSPKESITEFANKKIWDKVQNNFTINDDGTVLYKSLHLTSLNGRVLCKSKESS